MNIPYSRKYKLLKYKLDLAAKAYIVCFLMTVLFALPSPLFDQPMISPVSAAPSETSPVAGLDTEGGKPTEKQVKTYFQKIFGSSWKIAWSVAQNECNSKRKEWPVCINSWGRGEGTGEHSVGLMQINIARNAGKGAWVHWDKIPAGNTLGEKELWLGNWKNNILIGFVISKGGTDFSPWSAFRTAGFYKVLNSL